MSFWQRLCCQEADEPTRRPASNQRVLFTDDAGGKYTGEQLNHQRNGYGVYTYPNGDQYEGQWLQDQRHGRGKMLYSNGDFFMGEWVEDRREGRGLHVAQDMSKYEGEWKGDRIDGMGKLIDPDGSFYEGEFVRGEKDGRGYYYNSQNKKKYISTYRAGQLLTCDECVKESPSADSPLKSLTVNSVHIDQPKVTEEDINIYENSNPEIKDIEVEQVLTYLSITKMKELLFLKIHPKIWKLQHTTQWLKVIGLAHCQAQFDKNKVTGSVLLDLTEDDMRNELAMKLGERKRLLRALTVLKNMHSAKLIKEKRTLKHLKNYKRSGSASMPSSKPESYKTPKSMRKFVPSINHDPIVQENAENDDHDDSPSFREREKRFMKGAQKLYQPETVHELNFATEQFNSYNMMGLGNLRDEPKYESLNINDHDHTPRDSSQQREDLQFEEKEEEQEKQFMEELDVPPPMNRKEQSKRQRRKEQEQENALLQLPPLPVRKEQSRRAKATEELHDAALEQEEKKVEEEDSSSSSDSDNDQEERVHKRKKSREERPMQMRELYEYLKDHHISMNFLIPENQITNLEVIGEGGYGKVYKAKWMSNPVAVKTYLKAGRIHRESLDDFLKEVEILNNLRHPNVVLYMGMCIQINRYSLVTEYLEEGSLYDQLHKKHTKLSPERIYEIVEDIVLGMVYLHAKNILHRDLKSSNVLIGDDWKVKLCDFGLSQMHSKKKMKVGRARIGTYQWMAPEVLRKEKNIGFAADVYSFGMVLWELLTHKIPFEDYMPAQIEGLVGWDDGFKITSPTEGDPFLIRIMEQCLEKDPSKRPSFLQILDLLKEHEEEIKPKSSAVVPYSGGTHLPVNQL